MKKPKRRHLPEALIFDIDGTLLDVRNSFYATTIRASEVWWELIEKSLPPFKVDMALIERLKACPGFNDDWELTMAIILLQKWVNVRGGKPLEVIDSLSPIGLSGLEEKLNLSLPQEDKSFIRKICMEMYGGRECEFLYGFKPTFWKGDGLWKRERPLFDLSEVQKIFKIGIYTGRNPRETSLALRILKLNLPEGYVINAGDFLKPDPRGLFKLVNEMKVKHAVFIGDSEDDRLTVLNYRRKFYYPFVEFVSVRDTSTLKTFRLSRL